MHKCIQVAVGVIKNPQNQILITQRAQDVHMGGRWEFPGGKIEPQESPVQALIRELNEELGLVIAPTAVLSEVVVPLITLRYAYPVKTVELHVYEVFVQADWLPSELCISNQNCNLYQNGVSTKNIIAREGQQAQWVRPQDLPQFSFPDANQPILTALALPKAIPITPSITTNIPKTLASLCQQPYELLHVRLPLLPKAEYQAHLFGLANTLNDDDMQRVVVNTSLAIYEQLPYQHLHLNSMELAVCSGMSHTQGELKKRVKGWLSASCHNLEELEMAAKIGVDYVFYSPICATQTHPDVQPVGWGALSEFCQHATMPVYALGGVGLGDITQARECKAQGIASISAFSDE